MNYVKSFNLFGVPAMQIPSLTGSGAPTTATEGAIGCLYMDTDTGDLYKCTAVASGVYTWVEAGNGSNESGTGITDEEKTLILSLFAKAVYTEDMSATYNQLAALWSTSSDNSGDSGTSEEETHTHSYTSSVTTAATCTTAGVRTYTCSCGNSYTETIAATGHTYVDGVCTVCGAADPDYEEETTEPVYQLAEEQVFDGTAEYDTEYALWGGANEDFTLCLDFTDAATVKNTYPMYITGQTITAAYLYFYKTYNSGAFNARYNSGQPTAIGITSGVEHGKIVITHIKGETGITVHTASGETPVESSSDYPTNDAATIKLGANGFTGTVHDFKVYNRVLVEDEINEYLGVA